MSLLRYTVKQFLALMQDAITKIYILFSIRLTVVVALLAKQSLPALEVRSLNPVIRKSYIFTVNCTEETKIKKGREWPIQKSIARLQCFYVLTQSLCFNYLYLSVDNCRYTM